MQEYHTSTLVRALVQVLVLIVVPVSMSGMRSDSCIIYGVRGSICRIIAILAESYVLYCAVFQLSIL